MLGMTELLRIISEACIGRGKLWRYGERLISCIWYFFPISTTLIKLFQNILLCLSTLTWDSMGIHRNIEHPKYSLTSSNQASKQTESSPIILWSYMTSWVLRCTHCHLPLIDNLILSHWHSELKNEFPFWWSPCQTSYLIFKSQASI